MKQQLGKSQAGGTGARLPAEEMSVPKEVQTIEELIDALQEQGVREVVIAGRIATSTSPGGDQIAFRGSLLVSAEAASGETFEYVEQVMPYIANTTSPQISATAETAADLRAAQLALAGQLRAYRGEYQGVVSAARARLADRLSQAGIAVVEPGE